MKFLYLHIVFLFVTVCGYAQVNLVPNPSFETYTSCPTTQGQVSKATGWSIARLTAEYFNICATYTSTVGVPSSYFGYQYPSSGNGMMGFYGYIQTLASMKREAITCQLTTTLTVGTKYYVSFKTNLASINPDSNNYCYIAANDHLGALFSTVQYNTGSPSPINNFAHVYGNSIISDTMNWKQIFGSFIADSTYKYLTLGNFFDKAHTNATLFYPSCPDTFAYYFWDDICVSTDSLFTANWQWTGIENRVEKNNLSIFPNPATDYIKIEQSENPRPFSINIYNLMGTLLLSEKNFSGEALRLDIHSLPPQILFIQIIQDDRKYNYKITKT